MHNQYKLNNLPVIEDITMETLTDELSAATGRPKLTIKVTRKLPRKRPLCTLNGSPSNVIETVTFVPLEG